ncbi:MAG: hypothetical protein DCC71_15055 [Proteobacteria bacterium]|nr:MAG: hypothetical protein DCC71_15055 [Pseudomonadota bacterium]
MPGGTLAAPLDWNDAATWLPAGVPDASTDVVLAQPCAVRCSGGECAARTVKGTHPGASLEIAPGAALVLAGCDTASAYASSTYQCGGEAGFRFAPQGALVHDSAADGDPLVRGAALPAQTDRLRLVLSSAIDVVPGDWLQVRGGPGRSQVYRVVAADLTGCPAPGACHFDVSLHDPAMAFGKNPQTAGYATRIGYVAASAMRIAAPDHPQYAEQRLDRCVEICTQRSGENCVAASTLTRDGSYVGWHLGASDAALDPADPAVMGARRLVVETRNDLPQVIGSGGGQPDRVCFADPLPASWVPATGWAERSAVLWPGFWPGDAWAIFRPATVRYAGAEGDGGLGFHGACLDSDFAYFDGWSKIAAVAGTPACQEPFADTVVVAWARGIAGVPVDQQSGCNGHALDVLGYTALRGDRVAIVDTRTPLDTTGTCYPSGWPGDPARDSGTHGLALAGTSFDAGAPPAEWLIRYMGDDGIFAAGAGLGAVTWRLPRWTWWWNKAGVSTEVVDFLNSEPGQTVRLEDARVVMYASSAGCKGALDDPNGNVAYQVEGMLYVDPRHAGPVLGLGSSAGHDVEELVAFGDGSASCAALRSARVRRSWIEGWNRLVDYQVREVDRVFFASRGGAPTGSVFGTVPPGESALLRDFVATGLGNVSLLGPVCGTGCAFEMRDGFASWLAPTTQGVANFYGSANAQLAAPLAGLLFANSRLLTCSAGWGESGDDIGRNLLVSPGAYPIGYVSACPLAAPQKVVTATGFAARLPWRADLAGERFGPQRRVGLPAGAAIAADAGLASSFAIPEEPCDDGVDDDWDGLADLADPGCSDAADASERSAVWACDDGADNDGDGFADAGFDPGCPRPNAMPENPVCDDGIDNDGDLAIDFADPHCNPSWPHSEQPPPACGFGAELAALALLSRRFARASAARRGPRRS